MELPNSQPERETETDRQRQRYRQRHRERQRENSNSGTIGPLGSLYTASQRDIDRVTRRNRE